MNPVEKFIYILFGVTAAQLAQIWLVFYLYRILLDALPMVKEVNGHAWKTLIRGLHGLAGNNHVFMRGHGRAEAENK